MAQKTGSYTPSPASMPEIREEFEADSQPSENTGSQSPFYADYATEEAVISSILAEPDTLDTIVQKLGIESQEDSEKRKRGKNQQEESAFRREAQIFFRDPKHAVVYETIRDVNARGVEADLLTIAKELEDTGKLAVIGGMDYLVRLQSSISSTANLESWCSILRDCAMLREIIRTCSNALEICRSPIKDIREILNVIEGNFLNVRNSFTKADIHSFKWLLKDTCNTFMEILDKKRDTGILTGFPDLDRLTGGLRKQEMFVLAARPSIGKTAFALNIVRNIMMRDVENVPRTKIAFFSLEMSAEQVTQRLLCTESRVPLSSIMSRNIQHGDIQRITQAAIELAKAQLSIDPTGGLSVFELRAKARKIKESQGLDLIVIDYLTLMRAEVKAADGRQVEVAAISGGLKKIAKDLDVPVLVLAQLNRDVEKGQGGKNALPKLSNLRESGAIEQDADVVCFLHRNRDESKERGEAASREGVDAQVIVEKNRNGATGIVNMRFFPQLMEFRSIEHKYKENDVSV